jgi:transcriptional regulator with XRE-family HTH domain
MKPKTNGRRRAQLRHIDFEIGRRIRKARLAKGMSQTKLGEGMGVSFQQVQKYEAGANSVATCQLPGLCKTLAISITKLVADIDVSHPR